MVRLRQPWFFAFCALLLVCWLGAGRASAAPALAVDSTASIALWPAVTLRHDASHQLTLQQVLAEPQAFVAPTGTPGNLGRVADTVWLRMPLLVAGTEPQQRVLEIDYPLLNNIDVYLVSQGRVLSHQTLGSQVHVQQRPIGSRSMAAPLRLLPGAQDLLVRVRTQSSMVLPMTLHTPRTFLANESREQLLLGVLSGAALCMLVYSLAHWFSMRDAMFLHYAGVMCGSLLFLLAYFGVGQQMLWADWPDLGLRVAPLAILLSAACGSAFHRRALQMRQIVPRSDRVMQWLGAAALCALLAGALGLPYPLLQRVSTGLGVAIMLLTLPVVVMRARRGERVAWYMLFGLTAYVVGGVTLALLLGGRVQPTFMAQHVFLLTTMLEMAAWMGVLGLQVQSIHRNADRARVESDTLRALAQTDALTGLPNRRGLNQRLAIALPQATPQQLLAAYLLDLDGFKLVNDQHGHDVGDALLAAVGQRLQHQLRTSDVVARLGGDEFVVLAAGLADEAAARSLGEKMLDAFLDPFMVAGQRCQVGLTIGYALAPLDGSTADGLIKRADAAMYAGKQSGRHCLQRGGRSMAAA